MNNVYVFILERVTLFNNSNTIWIKLKWTTKKYHKKGTVRLY